MENARLYSLLSYTFEMNASFADQLLSIDREVDGKIVSFYAHILTAHHLWNQRILSRPSEFGVWELIDSSEWKEINKNNYETSLSILTGYAKDDVITYINTSGKSFSNTIEDIMFHVINHSTHHRAQISLLLRGNDIEPLKSDYILQLRKEL